MASEEIALLRAILERLDAILEAVQEQNAILLQPDDDDPPREPWEG